MVGCGRMAWGLLKGGGGTLNGTMHSTSIKTSNLAFCCCCSLFRDCVKYRKWSHAGHMFFAAHELPRKTLQQCPHLT